MYLTQEQKKEWSINKVNELKGQAVDYLRSALSNKANLDKLSKHYAYTNKFYKYSFFNSVLILLQKGELCQSYEGWKKLGRQVRAGQTSKIKVYVPMIKIDKETETSKCFGFKLGSVFDISQTDGEELSFQNNTNYEVENIDLIIEKVKSLTSKTINIKYMDEARGYVNTLEIALNKISTNSDQVKTLFHELGHELLGHVGNEVKNKEVKEVEAEAVAYLTMSGIGIDYEMSKEYIASWGSNISDLSKLDVVAIVKTTEKILEKLLGVKNGQSETI